MIRCKCEKGEGKNDENDRRSRLSKNSRGFKPIN